MKRHETMAMSREPHNGSICKARSTSRALLLQTTTGPQSTLPSFFCSFTAVELTGAEPQAKAPGIDRQSANANGSTAYQIVGASVLWSALLSVPIAIFESPGRGRDLLPCLLFVSAA
jgi:hypothetical protein